MLGMGLEIGSAPGSAFHLKLHCIFIHAALLRAGEFIHYGIVDLTFQLRGHQRGKGNGLASRGVGGSLGHCMSMVSPRLSRNPSGIEFRSHGSLTYSSEAITSSELG